MEWHSDTFNSFDSYDFEAHSNDCDMTTPNRKRYGLHTTETSVPGLRQQLQLDFQKRIYGDVAVKEFVHTVFDLSNEDIDAVLEYKFKPNTVAIFEYKRVLETGRLEKDFYQPFAIIAHDLLASYLNEKRPDEKPSIRLYQNRGDARLSQTHTNQHTRRSPAVGPDVISLWTSFNDPKDFAACQSPFEFKPAKRPRLAPVDEENPFTNGPVSDSRIAAPTNPISGSLSRRVIRSVQNPVSRRSLPRRAKASSSQEMSMSSETPQSSSDVSDRKRKRSIDDVGGRDTFTKNEAQLASYAVKFFESTSRFFVVGVYVRCWTIVLWYFDRMGASRTVSFDFAVDDVQMLGLVLVALHQADATHSGISPFLHAVGPQDPVNSLCSTTSQRFLIPPSVPLSTLSLVSNKLPPKCREKAILRFPCSIVDGEGNQSTGYRAFVIVAILFCYPGLIGRGTEAYLVHELLEAGLKASEDLVAKLAWCSVHRPPESATLRTLLANAPELSRHLPNVAFACVYDSDKHLCLPRYKLLSSDEWAKTDITGVDFEKRDLVVIVMKRYQPLWSVRNLDEFKKVFLDLVECHHRAYKKGGYLHRDISETNLMVDRSDDGTVTGVLCDWDLSSAVDDDGVVISSNATHHARKDKKTLLGGPIENAEQLFNEFHPDFEPLIEQWVEPLWQLFRSGYQKEEARRFPNTRPRSKLNIASSDDFNISFGGILTFENFMDALGEKPRQWDDGEL
ncbi:hypothetical protein EV360DRAFT_87665 [Lentinula raphanica]|nr:hypothetical protein EV360DRAFT_87665 [Lentinula raphanica]